MREMRVMNKLSLKGLCALVRVKKKTLIYCHKNPDPDTLGSSFGLKHILEHFGSEVKVADCDEPSAKFHFITGGVSLTDGYDIDEYERVIAVDVASPAQLGAQGAFAERVDLTIDHHESNTRFSDYYEEFSPACAMIIYELARALKILKKLPKHFFECIYAGLSGDTGCFKYSNTNERAMVIGAELISSGIDFAEINRRIFDSLTVGEISANRMVYDNVELLYDGRLAIIFATNELKARYGICEADVSDIVNTVRQIDGVLVAVSIKQSEKDEGKFFISSRANAEIDVSRLCASLGGGGHTRAAGATITAEGTAEAYKRVKNTFAEGVLSYAE